MMSGGAGSTQRSDLLTLKSSLFLHYSMHYSMPFIKKQRTEVNLTKILV